MIHCELIELAIIVYTTTIVLLLTPVSPSQTYVVPACRPDGPAVAWAIAKEGGGGGGGGGGGRGE